MATLPVQTITPAGVVPAMQAAAGGGDQFTNDRKTVLRVTNGGGGSINVTIPAQISCNKGTLHNTVVAVAAAATKEIGPFDDTYTDGTGAVQVTYSGVTTVTVGAFSR